MPSKRSKYKVLRITHAQAEYLVDLIRDDLQDTDLTPDEVQSATGLLHRTEDVLAAHRGSTEGAA